jgi:hypothetical protein
LDPIRRSRPAKPPNKGLIIRYLRNGAGKPANKGHKVRYLQNNLVP